MSALTRRQTEIIQFLEQHGERFTHPPTLDELCKELGLSSRGSLHKHIHALIDAGLLEPLNQKQRGVRLKQRPAPTPVAAVLVPFYGYIAAGHPIDAITGADQVAIPVDWLRGRDGYVLRVRGSSMVDDGILDGDQVVVEARCQAINGDTVVALIDGRNATLKRLELRADKLVLHPANPLFQPMTYAPERVEIQGVVRGLIRLYNA